MKRDFFTYPSGTQHALEAFIGPTRSTVSSVQSKSRMLRRLGIVVWELLSSLIRKKMREMKLAQSACKLLYLIPFLYMGSVHQGFSAPSCYHPSTGYSVPPRHHYDITSLSLSLSLHTHTYIHTYIHTHAKIEHRPLSTLRGANHLLARPRIWAGRGYGMAGSRMTCPLDASYSLHSTT